MEGVVEVMVVVEVVEVVEAVEGDVMVRDVGLGRIIWLWSWGWKWTSGWRLGGFGCDGGGGGGSGGKGDGVSRSFYGSGFCIHIYNQSCSSLYIVKIIKSFHNIHAFNITYIRPNSEIASYFDIS